MERFSLSIETGNAAFERRPGREIARILRELADKIEGDAIRDGSGRLRDVNGNTVGRWNVDGGEG